MAWLHEVFQRPEFRLYYQPTLGQCSDIFTKPFTTAATWRHACDLIGIITGEVAGAGRGGGNALQAWADRVRSAQTPGLSKTGGEKKRTTCPLRASHDETSTHTSTDSTRTTAAAAAAVVDVQSSRRSNLLPALCAPALLLPLARLLPGFHQVAAMSSAGASYAAGKGKALGEGGAATGGAPGGKAGAAKAGRPGGSKGPKPGSPVAETPQGDRGRSSTDARGSRGRSQSRDRRDGPRGRPMARRREGSYDPRGASMSTNRSRSASAFRDRNTDDLLPERLYTLSRILVKLCRHRATDH